MSARKPSRRRGDSTLRSRRGERRLGHALPCSRGSAPGRAVPLRAGPYRSRQGLPLGRGGRPSASSPPRAPRGPRPAPGFRSRSRLGRRWPCPPPPVPTPLLLLSRAACRGDAPQLRTASASPRRHSFSRAEPPRPNPEDGRSSASSRASAARRRAAGRASERHPRPSRIRQLRDPPPPSSCPEGRAAELHQAVRQRTCEQGRAA